MPMRTQNLINQGRAECPASPLTSSCHVNQCTLPSIRAHAIVPTQLLVKGNSENAWVHTPATVISSFYFFLHIHQSDLRLPAA
jgi:hypothetical protein